MCTGFIKKGEDIVFGYNLDLPDELWDFRVCPKKDAFYVGIKVKGRIYKTHGVSARGQFAVLPYMNAPACGPYRRGRAYRRLDLLVNDYIAGKLDYRELRRVTGEKQIVNAPGCSMHALFGDAEGHMLLVEPGLGAAELPGDFAVVGNFPIRLDPALRDPALEAWYGVDRYQKAEALLAQADKTFGLAEGMRVLEAVSLSEGAPTRVSFVYSVRTQTLRWALDRNFAEAKEYRLRGE